MKKIETLPAVKPEMNRETVGLYNPDIEKTIIKPPLFPSFVRRGLKSSALSVRES